MKLDAPTQFAAEDPVGAALQDSAVQARLTAAARAIFGKRGDELSRVERIAEAHAIVQEAALRAWARREQFDASRDVVKWLVGFVMNVAREQVRERSRERLGAPQDGSSLESLVVDPGRDAPDAIADQLLASHLLEQLSSLDRQIVEMKYWQAMTCNEIGRQLNLSENAVRVRLHRALNDLKGRRRAAGEDQP
jgi:RNA polymerase sigma-70 factor (ECF subfamily)